MTHTCGYGGPAVMSLDCPWGWFPKATLQVRVTSDKITLYILQFYFLYYEILSHPVDKEHHDSESVCALDVSLHQYGTGSLHSVLCILIWDTGMGLSCWCRCSSARWCWPTYRWRGWRGELNPGARPAGRPIGTPCPEPEPQTSSPGPPGER